MSAEWETELARLEREVAAQEARLRLLREHRERVEDWQTAAAEHMSQGGTEHGLLWLMRIRAGLTQEQVAEAISKSRATVSSIEAGGRRVHTDLAKAWAQACGFRARLVFEPLPPPLEDL